MIENQETEFKREYTDDLKKEVVAFLNTNDGTIYIGLNNDGSICGVADIDVTMQKISSSLRNAILPDCTRFFHMESCSEQGKHYLRLNIVKGTQTPYYLSEKGIRPSGVYIRVGNTTVQASEDMIRELIREANSEKYEDIKAYRQDLTFKAVQRVFDERNVEFGQSQMRTLGLLDTEGFYTNLALLLSDQCEHSIKCAIFEDTTKKVFKDRKEFGGSLIEQVDRVLEYLNVYNKTASVIGDKLREDAREYPPTAIREALLNAVVHREYSYSGSTFVNLYADRIEIMSLGGLPDGISLEAVRLGISQPRNRKLANIFYRLNYIEAYGTGIPRIYEYYCNTGKKPSIMIVKGAFQICLPNLLYETDAQTKKKNSHEQEILKYLEEHEIITKVEAAKLIGTKEPRAYMVLRTMAENGMLSRSRQGKKYIYAKK